MTRVAFLPDDRVAEIIKRGEERARYGQTNSVASSTPFINKRQIRPKHHLTRKVAALLPELEFQKFHAMVDPDEWNRLHEVKDLALQQVRDDWGQSQFQKFGKQTVASLNDAIEAEPLWPEPTRTQEALAEGMAPHILKLTEVQQETLRYRHWQRLSQSETGKMLHVGKKSVEMNESRAYVSLGKHLLEAYPEEVEDGIESCDAELVSSTSV